MATQSLALADKILKDLYVGPIVEMLNQKTYLLDQLQRDADHVDHTGRRAVVPVHKNRNYGQVSTGDAGTLPNAGRQDWEDAIIPLRYHYAGVELTDVAIEATQSSEGAFISVMEAESRGVAQDMKKQINRQAYGTGDGAMATVSGTPGAGTSITVDSVQYLKTGMVVDIVLKATGATTNGVLATTITNVTPSTNTITIGTATAGATANTYGVYLSNGVAPASGGSSRNNEMDGLRNITGNSRVLHSIDSSVAGNQYWDSAASLDATGGAGGTAIVGESFYEQIADFVGGVGNGDVEVFLTSRGMKRRLADTYQSQKRFNDATAVTVHGGYTAILVNEIPVIADDDCPKGFAFAINRSALKWFEQVGPGWLDINNGSIFQLKTTATAGQRQAVWQAWFKWYVALGCVAPNRTGRIFNGTDDVSLAF
jgi:hypothetical protein